MTRGVTEALRQRLERVRRRKLPEATAAELLAVGRYARALADSDTARLSAGSFVEAAIVVEAQTNADVEASSTC